MEQATQCPDENDVLELVRGRLGREGAEALQVHIDGCPECRMLVAELARGMNDAPPALVAAEDHGRSPRDLLPGTVVAERYRLDSLLGEGGTGVVWAATHTLMSRAIALKFLRVPGPDHVRRFLREARVTATLRHPHIVEVHDIFELPDGTPVMVMDLLHGESLQGRLSRGRLAVTETAQLLLPVVSAVGAAHAAGVVHRDLKPENIFLVRGAEAVANVKVLDFGLAKLTASEGRAAKTKSLTRTGSLLGTPHYMSPEQVCAEKDVDHRADVWALGVILYQCLAGKRPIAGKSFGQIFKAITAGPIVPLQEVAPEVPSHFAALVGRMMARDRRARPADLREVFEVLSAATVRR